MTLLAVLVLAILTIYEHENVKKNFLNLPSGSPEQKSYNVQYCSKNKAKLFLIKTIFLAIKLWADLDISLGSSMV